MGEAKIKKNLPQHTLDLDVVRQAGIAIQKLASAASSALGSDCLMHAMIGQFLLASKGIKTELAIGFAAWRTGQSDGSVISHTIAEKSFSPKGKDGYPFHAWLVAGNYIIDYTTYQLRQKAAELDAMDGGHTELDWCPEMLITERKNVSTYRSVANGNTGQFHYDRNTDVETFVLKKTEPADPDDLAAAMAIFQNPDIAVFGPNDIKAD